jgi:putative membrane protein
MSAVSTLAIRATARALAARRLVLRVQGLEHVPERGPVLVVARHVHHLWDGVALLAGVPRALRIVVALDWVRGRGMRRVMEAATEAAGWPVVLRGDALAVGPDGHPRNTGGAYRLDEAQRYQLRGMRNALRVLVDGGALAVFPEAYPNVDPGYTPKRALDELLPFRPGFASIAGLARDRRRLAVPIVPTGLVYHRGARSTVTVRFGAPIELGARQSPETLVPEAERRVAELCGLRQHPDAPAERALAVGIG